MYNSKLKCIKIIKSVTLSVMCLSIFIVIQLLSISNALSASNIQKAGNTNNSLTNTATNQTATTTNIVAEKTADKAEKYPPDRPFSDSLFFTPEEISAIQRAILGVNTPDEDTGPKPPRILKLSGLIYNSPNNWVIWLNSNRLTPKRLLPEIIDISVESDKVHLKWFDYGINDVISITLRPHQVYDIETGILLPG